MIPGLLSSLVVALATALPAHAEVRTESPLALTTEVTDPAGVVDDPGALVSDLEQVHDETGVQLFVVYVDSFDGVSGEEWAARTYDRSGLGGQDVVLAVAVEDRRYGTHAGRESKITAGEDQQVRAGLVEPALAQEDWDGAARAAAQGYARAASSAGSGSGGGIGLGLGFLFLPMLCLAVPFLGIALPLLASRRRRRAVTVSRPSVPVPSRPPAVPVRELRARASSALVAMDEAVRASSDELSYAEKQFGREVTRRFRDVLDAARRDSAEAFRLHAEAEDGGRRLGEAGLRQRYEQVLALAGRVDRELDGEAEEFVRLRDLEATVPDFLGELGTRVGDLRARMPAAEQELIGLRATWPDAALRSVGGAVEEASRMVDSADGLVANGWQHLAPGQEDRRAAVAAARAAEDAASQADKLLAGVTRARTELATAAERVGPAVASLQSDLDDVTRLRADDPVTRTAAGAAREALAAAERDRSDPLTLLRMLGRAELDLDNALARYRESEEQRGRTQQVLSRRFTEVHGLLQEVEGVLDQYRGAMGHRTRSLLSEAVRAYEQARSVARQDPEAAAASLDASERRAEEAYASAQDDLAEWGGGPGGGFGPTYSMGGLGLGALVLGGVLAGGLSRGGGWGGWGGGFGGGGDFGGGDAGGGGAF